MARTPPPGLIAIEDSPQGEPGIATLCGVKPGTIRKWRMRKYGPHTWRANGMVVSTADAVAEWLEQLKNSALEAA